MLNTKPANNKENLTEPYTPSRTT